jgi:hypothetical protein
MPSFLILKEFELPVILPARRHVGFTVARFTSRRDGRRKSTLRNGLGGQRCARSSSRSPVGTSRFTATA